MTVDTEGEHVSKSSARPRPPPPALAADAWPSFPVPPIPLAGRPIGVHARASLLFAASRAVSAAEVGLAAEAEAESEPRYPPAKPAVRTACALAEEESQAVVAHQPCGPVLTRPECLLTTGFSSLVEQLIGKCADCPVLSGSFSACLLSPGKMFLVGLTGGIASGKSSVIQVFQQLGCAVIDVDVIARHVVQPGYPAHRRIVEAFGTEVLLENGDIDRKVLGDLIFNQPDRRQLLNSITHPEIRKEMMKETFKYFLRGYRYVILDIPLLFETKKLLKYMKHTVVVYCDRDTQLARLMKRNSLSREDAEARINAQLPLKDKARMANHVLDNSGEWSLTRRQVILLHAKLERSMEYLPLRLGFLTGLAGIASLLYLLTRYLLPSP
ncbi:Dephospho-CoA kinase domain-containing protein [Microtus ochrogaster]|uniref:Dephospho-CoA kinase domain-containing protein n=3 Tax=Muroidea TaxID=337687 RepID=A0A8J6GKN7_MICOH|nr:Dephospho-CoA kinase domain-containing protein [Microtus ochrogaster]